MNRFNLTQTGKYDGLALGELIERFRAVRQETVRIVREMKEEDLEREGMHAFHGKGKLDRFIRWAYEHVRWRHCEATGKGLGVFESTISGDCASDTKGATLLTLRWWTIIEEVCDEA